MSDTEVVENEIVYYNREKYIKRVVFKDCEIVEGKFMNCEFINCIFRGGTARQSEFRDCRIQYGLLKDSAFIDCQILGGNYVYSVIYGSPNSSFYICRGKFEECILTHCRATMSVFEFCKLREVDIDLCEVCRCQITNCDISQCDLDDNSYSLDGVSNMLYYLAAKAGVTFFRDSAGELWGTVQRSTLSGGAGQFTDGFVEREGYFIETDCNSGAVCSAGKHGGTDAAYYHSSRHKGKELWAMMFKMKDLVACDGVKVKVRAGYMHRVGKLPWVGEK